ncbi:permease [Dactylosporangium sp. McL0621]|uniref:permease n=1 Tax=Dactylosporangium sp. McL0621 TaxID=3415678 RepID=UPI003CFB30CF
MVVDALAQANNGVAGSMEGYAAMDMSVAGPGSFRRRLTSARGFTAVSHIFVMEWAAIWRDIAAGLLITGALAAWVPEQFWKAFFLTDHPVWSALWGPLVGPVVAVVSFVCSIGNVPLAAVLWNGGIRFGGVVSFLFADLIILPILNIYLVLRLEGGRLHRAHLLRHHGPRRLRSRPRTAVPPVAGWGVVLPRACRRHLSERTAVGV